MPRVRCVFIDQADSVGGFEFHGGAGRVDAVGRAGEPPRDNPGAVTIEVWDCGQFVARIPREIGRDRT